MSEVRTASILQRVPVILAVTAASYGLPLQGVQAPRASAKPADAPKPREKRERLQHGKRLQEQH